MPDESVEAPRKEHQKPLAKRANLMSTLAKSADMPMPTAPKKKVVVETVDVEDGAVPASADGKDGGAKKEKKEKKEKAPSKISAGMEAAGIVLVAGEWVPAHKAKEVEAANALAAREAAAAAAAALAPAPSPEEEPTGGDADGVDTPAEEPKEEPAEEATETPEEATETPKEEAEDVEKEAEKEAEKAVEKKPEKAVEKKPVVKKGPPKPPAAVTVLDTRVEELICHSPLALFECLELVLNDPDPQKSVVKESALVILWKLAEHCERAKAQALDEYLLGSSTAGPGAGVGAGVLAPSQCEPRIVKLLPCALRCLGSHKYKEKRVQAAAIGACKATVKMCGAHTLTGE
jgi:hypothetical protein